MQQLPFSQPGRFYRGNLHMHSTMSDGTLCPEEVVLEYREQGYDFISLTDHFLPGSYFKKANVDFIRVTDTATLNCSDFTTLLGAEIHGPSLSNGEQWHFVAVGLPADFEPLGATETGPEIAKRAAAIGAFVGIAHPAWYSLTLEDIRPVLSSCHAVETYNHASSGVDRGDGWHFLDALLAEGKRLTAFAADDSHFKHPIDPRRDAFGGWVHVKAASQEPADLLAALKAGAYYSSTGPELRDVRIEDDELIVECSSVEQILITGRGARSARKIAHNLETARFPLAPWRELGYCRVTVMEADGGRAWSNPIWLDGGASQA